MKYYWWDIDYKTDILNYYEISFVYPSIISLGQSSHQTETVKRARESANLVDLFYFIMHAVWGRLALKQFEFFFLKCIYIVHVYVCHVPIAMFRKSVVKVFVCKFYEI